MHNSLRRALFTLMLVCLAGGCAVSGPAPKCECETKTTVEPTREEPPKLGSQRMMLSEGYSKLYASAGKLDLSEWVLFVKNESKDVQAIVTAVAGFGGELRKDLERIARDYPGVRIDIDVQPEMEKRTRVAIAKDLGQRFAPVVGRGGREYERTLLIGYSIALAHERYLSRVMAEEEPDPGLKKFLLATEKRYGSLYDRSVALLDKEYFSNPRGKAQE